MPESPRKPIRVLSLDGGGVRGILSSLLLVALENEIKRQSANPDARLVNYFDLIAGTSIGGILTAFLTAPNLAEFGSPRYSATQIHELMLQYLATAFSNVHNKGGAGILAEKYDGHSLAMLMRMTFSHTSLSELIRPTLITAYDIEANQAIFFCSHDYYSTERLATFNLNPIQHEPKSPWFVRDICRATAAAPLLFKPASIAPVNNKEQPRIMIDGGVFANNPAICAYAEVRAKWANQPRVNDIQMVSVGTGNTYLDIRTGGYLTGWGMGLQLIELLMNSGSEAAHFQMRRIYAHTKAPPGTPQKPQRFGWMKQFYTGKDSSQPVGRGDYWRFDWDLKKRVELDKADKKSINVLLAAAMDPKATGARDWYALGADAAKFLRPSDLAALSEVVTELLAE